MIKALNNLKTAISAYGIPHLNQEEETLAEKKIVSTLSKLEQRSYILYSKTHNIEMAVQSFQKFYSQLRQHFNQVYRKKNNQVDHLVLQFHELFKNYEDSYSQDMNLEELLTDYQYHLLKAELQEKFPVLKEALLQKKIWIYLLLEIQSAIDKHFRSPISHIRYYHYLFFSKLLQSLSHIAEDNRDKDWERRFIETMININFNHMGFFNRCTELINFRLRELSEENKILCIDENELRLSQAARDPKISFDTNREHLADLLIDYANKAKIEIIERAYTLTSQADQIDGIMSNLTVGELIVFYHYFQKGKFLKAITKRIGAKNFVDHVLTINNAKISEIQLVKFDRKKYAHEISSFKKKLLEIIKLIDIDLDKGL